MTHLPVNATTPERALRIAQDAAETMTPKGFILTIDALAFVEHPARPFANVALSETSNGIAQSRMSTYVFGVTVARLVDIPATIVGVKPSEMPR